MEEIEKIFVIRIYRQDEGSPSEVIGIVEESSSGRKTAFRTFEELVSIISRKD